MSVKAKADKAAADEEENRKRQEENDKKARKKECLKGLALKCRETKTSPIPDPALCMGETPRSPNSCTMIWAGEIHWKVNGMGFLTVADL